MAKEILIETGKKAGGKLFSPAFFVCDNIFALLFV